MFGIDPALIAQLQTVLNQLQRFMAETNAQIVKLDARLESIEKRLGVNENG